MKSKILVLSSRFPYPPIGGDKIRIYNIIKLLSQGYKVDLLSISETKVNPNDDIELKKLGINTINFVFNPYRYRINSFLGIFTKLPLQTNHYYFSKVQEWINTNYKNYDLIFCFHIRTTEYVKYLPITKCVDLVDAISLNYKRAQKYTSGIWGWIYKIETKRVLEYELKTVNSFDKALIVSQVDKDFLTQHGANAVKIDVLPVAVDESYLNYQAKIEKNWFTFVGKMNTVANADAVAYFSYDIFPKIKEHLPETEFYIVGADPNKKVNSLAQLDGVHVTGRVDDHTQYILDSKVVVAPMRFGAGMQNKILEAMALGKAVVTTTIGAEGINGVNGKHFLIADNADSFANLCIDLYRNKNLREEIGNNARQLIKENYTWNILGKKLSVIMKDLIENKHNSNTE